MLKRTPPLSEYIYIKVISNKLDIVSVELVAMFVIISQVGFMNGIVISRNTLTLNHRNLLNTYYLKLCDKTVVYPCIHASLKIMATLLMTAVENERSFSDFRL